MKVAETPPLFRSALRFFSGTLLSRFSGLFRDLAMAFFFGASPRLAAFLVSYRLIYLFRRLFGEGSLHQGLIPLYEEKKKEDPHQGFLFFRDALWTFGAIALLIVVSLEGVVALFQASGLIPAEWREIIHFFQLLLPSLVFIALFGVQSGFLHSENRFLSSSLAPVSLNLVWTLAVLCFASLSEERAFFLLSLSLVFGFFLTWAFTLAVTPIRMRDLLPRRLFSPQLKVLTRPLLLGLLGASSTQVNSAVDAVFARVASLEGPAYLWYAIRMQQLPLALFGIAISTALLPALSRATGKGNKEEFQTLLSQAIQRTCTLIIPCTIGIFVLGAVSVNLLYGRGDFSSLACVETTKCLWLYGFGLLPAALVQIVAPAFYARKDYETPARGFALSAVCNICLNFFFVFGLDLGVASIAIATSLSAFLNAIYLFYRLEEKRFEGAIRSGLKISLASSLAGAGALFVGALFTSDPTLLLWKGEGTSFTRSAFAQIGGFSLQATIFFALLIALAKLFKAEDLFTLIHFRRKPT